MDNYRDITWDVDEHIEMRVIRDKPIVERDNADFMRLGKKQVLKVWLVDTRS
jgi:hypothetical protein